MPENSQALAQSPRAILGFHIYFRGRNALKFANGGSYVGPFCCADTGANGGESMITTCRRQFYLGVVMILMLLTVVLLSGSFIPPASTPSTVRAPQDYRSVVLGDKPVAYWRLGERTGTVAHDSAGADNAPYVGTPLRNTLGAIMGDANGAVGLRGGNKADSIRVPASESLDIRQGTLEAWFKANDVMRNQKIIVLQMPASHSGKFTLGIIAGHFYPDLKTSSGKVYTILTGTVIAGEWYHFVATYRPSDHFFRVYVNGGQLAEVTTDGEPIAHVGRARATIGGWADVGFWFNGMVDEAAVYNVALSPLQVRDHYNTATLKRAGMPKPITNGYVFGVLNAQPEHAARDHAAGVRAAEMEIGWDWYEPRDGVFSDVNSPGSYAYQMKREFRAFRAAGLKVILGIGLQYSPGWVFNYRDSHYMNQYGARAPGYPNLTFSQALRRKAEEYIARVNRDLGLNNFWAVRVGSGPQVETLLPEETAGGHANGYWAYDAAAQGADANRPSSIPPNPYPGWRPGSRTYNGQPFSAAQVGQWADWYLGALMDGVNWQLATYRNLGYGGYLHVLMPGWGNRPGEYAAAVGGYLDGTGDSLQTMGRGAVWDRDIAKIADRTNVVIDVSSVSDNSSQSAAIIGANLCQAGDVGVDVNDPQVMQWSSTRWISYNAHRYGMPTIGENPDPEAVVGRYNVQMMQDAVRLVQSCGMQGLLWAFDGNLHDKTSPVTLSDYAKIVAQYPH